MIDKEKLFDSFQFIGENRMSFYIKLYLKANSNFISNAGKFYNNKNWEKLASLIHKVKGSSSIFYADEMQNAFIKVEKQLIKGNIIIKEEDMNILIDKYKLFIKELDEILINQKV